MNHNGTDDEHTAPERKPLSTVDKPEVDNVLDWTSKIAALFEPQRRTRTKAVRPKAQKGLNRILMRVSISADKCWEWTGAKSNTGYGRVKHNDGKRSFLALPHRVVAHAMGMIGSVRAVPRKNEVVMHSCDNPLCCRPDHLSAGTMADNTADCIRKGRAVWQK